jgi:ppGpp synthetase/RelA/SpoT-type nucleotidyltranferase
MIGQSDFLDKYRIDREKFKACGLDWDELSKIAADYERFRPHVEPTAKYIADCLRQVSAVHSFSIRVKDPEHLIQKIIRKKLDDSSLDFSVENYRTNITDLIGIRALHLFKEDWIQIHDFITGKWELREKPIANIRKGDSESFINEFKERGCEIKEHRFGYRSIHYLVQSQPTRNLHLAEIQVRTIFEEGWSEIDHRIRYPYDMDNPILSQSLFIFNRLAGSADEMASFVRLLKSNFEESYRKAQGSLEEKDRAIKELREQVKNLMIEKKEKERIEAQIETLSQFHAIIPSPKKEI